MNFLVILLRILSILVFLVGAFTCIILIGFVILGLARDMNDWADELERKI